MLSTVRVCSVLCVSVLLLLRVGGLVRDERTSAGREERLNGTQQGGECAVKQSM